MNTARPRAFTIIELAVVVVIVGVLLALMFPAIGAARRIAHRTTCHNNLRTLHAGFRLYQDANQNHLPPAHGQYSPAEDRTEPVQALASYLGVDPPAGERGGFVGRQPWACPADQSAYPKYGMSYFYEAEPLISYFEFRGGNPMGRLSAFYESTPDYALLSEISFPGHAARKSVTEGQPNLHARYELPYSGAIVRKDKAR